MELFEEKLTLHVPSEGLKLTVQSYATSDNIKAMKPYLRDSQIITILSDEENWSIKYSNHISNDVRYVLDCIGRPWVEANKIQAIKLVRKITSSGLKEAKDAVEEYLNVA